MTLSKREYQRLRLVKDRMKECKNKFFVESENVVSVDADMVIRDSRDVKLILNFDLADIKSVVSLGLDLSPDIFDKCSKVEVFTEYGYTPSSGEKVTKNNNVIYKSINGFRPTTVETSSGEESMIFRCIEKFLYPLDDLGETSVVFTVNEGIDTLSTKAALRLVATNE